MEPRLRLRDLLSPNSLDFCDSDSDDELFLSALNTLETKLLTAPSPELIPSPAQAVLPSPAKTRPTPSRFAAPKTEEDIKSIKLNGIPKTQDDTQYCLRVWEEWCKYRRNSCGDNIAPVTEMQPLQLQYWLTRFILEVRKKDGAEYPPNTLYHFCCGMMRFLRWNGLPSINFFTDAAFAEFRCTLDREMKCLQAQGVGSKKQANRASHSRRGAPLEEGNARRCHSTEPSGYNCVHEWALFCSAEWQRASTVAIFTTTDRSC